MSTMNDTLVRGKTFAAATGLKTGADLEDLATRAYPTAASQLVDQATLETYSDAAVVDDDGAAINRVRVKDSGIVTAKLNAKAVTAAKMALLPCFHARPTSSAQNVAYDSYDAVVLGTEIVDSHGYFAANAFTPLVAGYYVFVLNVAMSGVNGAGAIEVAVLKNGTGVVASVVDRTGGGAFSVSCGMVTPPIAANGTTDAFTAQIYHNVAGKTGLVDSNMTFFGGWFVCGAA